MKGLEFMCFLWEKRFILGVLCAVVWGFRTIRARDF